VYVAEHIIVISLPQFTHLAYCALVRAVPKQLDRKKGWIICYLVHRVDSMHFHCLVYELQIYDVTVAGFCLGNFDVNFCYLSRVFLTTMPGSHWHEKAGRSGNFIDGEGKVSSVTVVALYIFNEYKWIKTNKKEKNGNVLALPQEIFFRKLHCKWYILANPAQICQVVTLSNVCAYM